jgi:hypothetical protein
MSWSVDTWKYRPGEAQLSRVGPMFGWNDGR